MVYKFTAHIMFSYDDNGTPHNAQFATSADISRKDFDTAAAAFKNYVGSLLSDLVLLAIPNKVKTGVEGTLDINYMCESEDYYDVDSDDVYVGPDGITYSWETDKGRGTRIAVDIKGDTDREDVDLPDWVEIPDYVGDDIDAISDYLSGKTGFCHFGFHLVRQ